MLNFGDEEVMQADRNARAVEGRSDEGTVFDLIDGRLITSPSGYVPHQLLTTSRGGSREVSLVCDPRPLAAHDLPPPRDPSVAVELVSLTHELGIGCGDSGLPYPSVQVLQHIALRSPEVGCGLWEQRQQAVSEDHEVILFQNSDSER